MPKSSNTELSILPTPDAHEALITILQDVEFLAGQRLFPCATHRLEELRSREARQLEREESLLTTLKQRPDREAVELLETQQHSISSLLRELREELARHQCGDSFHLHLRALRQLINQHEAEERRLLMNPTP